MVNNSDCYYVVRFVSRSCDRNEVTGFLAEDNEIVRYYCAAWLFNDFKEASDAARLHNYHLPGDQAADVCKVPIPEFVHTVDYS